MPYERPGTEQAKFKEQGKSQSTEERHWTQKPQRILDRKILKKNLEVPSDLHRIAQGSNFTQQPKDSEKAMA